MRSKLVPGHILLFLALWLNLCNNSDQTLFSNALTFARLKISAFGLGFQHLPRDLANVNA